MQAEILRELWNCELKILDEVDRICRKHNLNYYLMWGTLIGAVRHGGFIPWDDDIDICMPRKDYQRFLKIAQKELTNEYFLQTPKTDKWSLSYFSRIRLQNTALYIESDKRLLNHHGIFIDIMPLDNCKIKDSHVSKFKKKLYIATNNRIISRRKTKKKQERMIWKMVPTSLLLFIRDWAMRGKGDYYTSWGYRFKKTDFLPVIEMEFEGKKYNAPNNYHKVLTTIYGDYMQLPPIEKRVAHEPAFISFNLEEDADKLKHYLEELNAE